MHMEGDSRDVPVIITLGANDEEFTRVRNTWWNFDVRTCESFKDEDKCRILSVVEGHPGGCDGFYDHVWSLATALLGITVET